MCVVDAYRTDVLEPRERGLGGGSTSVFGYRLAMILSGGIAFIWAEQWGSWPRVYPTMAGIMGLLPRCPSAAAAFAQGIAAPGHGPGREFLGFVAMMVGVICGRVRVGDRIPRPAGPGSRDDRANLQKRWISARLRARDRFTPCRWRPGRRARPASRRC